MKPLSLLFAAMILLCACESSPPPAAQVRPSTSTPTRTVTFEPERLVKVEGDRSFSTRCAGTGPTDVMLVSGYGVPMDEGWTRIQPTISGFTRVCAYDRLGIGRSDAPPALQRFEDMAADLDRVMSSLQLRRPVVVVAHSLGGPIAMAWASTHPESAKGLVLLDISAKLAGEELARQVKTAPFSLEVSSLRLDIERFDDPRSNVESLDPKAWDSLSAFARVGAVPLVLLVREKVEIPAAEGLDPQRIEAAAREDQRRWAAMSDHSRVEVAAGSGHAVQLDRPDLVIREVRRMVG